MTTVAIPAKNLECLKALIVWMDNRPVNTDGSQLKFGYVFDERVFDHTLQFIENALDGYLTDGEGNPGDYFLDSVSVVDGVAYIDLQRHRTHETITLQLTAQPD